MCFCFGFGSYVAWVVVTKYKIIQNIQKYKNYNVYKIWIMYFCIFILFYIFYILIYIYIFIFFSYFVNCIYMYIYVYIYIQIIHFLFLFIHFFGASQPRREALHEHTKADHRSWPLRGAFNAESTQKLRFKNVEK